MLKGQSQVKAKKTKTMPNRHIWSQRQLDMPHDYDMGQGMLHGEFKQIQATVDS